VAGFCEHSEESSDLTKVGNCLNTFYQLLEKGPQTTEEVTSLRHG
jgi:hypothetical protein